MRLLPRSKLLPSAIRAARILPRAWLDVNSMLFCLLFMFGCADLASVPLAGGNFRVFYLLAFAVVLANLPRLKMNCNLAWRSVALLFFLVPSIVFSIDKQRSELYVVWTVLTIICTFGVFPLLASGWRRSEQATERLDVHDLLLKIYRIQIVAALVLWLAGFRERPQFFYYEPSYFSISLAVYCALVAQRWRAGQAVLLDLVLAAIYLVTSASGAFFLVLFITLLLNLSAFRAKHLLLALAVAVVTFCLYVGLIVDVNTILIRGVLSGELDWFEILLRGGNRLARMLAAWSIFLDHPIEGVGYGAFELATTIFNFDDQSNNVSYLSGEGKPAINIYLEILATTGIIGFMGFAVFSSSLFKWIFGAGRVSPLSKGVICMLVILTWEANFLRPYVWIALSLCWFESRHGISRVTAGTAS